MDQDFFAHQPALRGFTFQVPNSRSLLLACNCWNFATLGTETEFVKKGPCPALTAKMDKFLFWGGWGAGFMDHLFGRRLHLGLVNEMV